MACENAPKDPWPHAPVHQLSKTGTYIVTAATYRKEHHFRGAERLSVLERGILKLAAENGWQLEAWAVFSNHYHFVAHSPSAANAVADLSNWLGLLHARTAGWVNRLDGTPGRNVWHNFWETRITFQKSYLARLNYVHRNALHHGLVPVASVYPWCSASWFEQRATPAQVHSLYRFKTEAVRVVEFDPAPEW
jgi:putative transposase